MVKQTRILVDVADILQLRLICGQQDEGKRCDGEVLYQFGKHKIERTWRCPKCGSPWKTEFGRHEPTEMRQVSAPEAASFALLDALESLAGPCRAQFEIRFEINGDEESGGLTK